MRKTIVLLALCLFVSTVALAHEGHKHKLLGTVKSLEENKLELTLKDGETKLVMLNDKTEISKGEHKADRSAIVEGARVAVEVDEDDIALTVKVAEANINTDARGAGREPSRPALESVSRQELRPGGARTSCLERTTEQSVEV